MTLRQTITQRDTVQIQDAGLLNDSACSIHTAQSGTVAGNCLFIKRYNINAVCMCHSPFRLSPLILSLVPTDE